MARQYLPIFECKDGQPVTVGPGYYVVTAITADGETPFCAPVHLGTVGPTPPPIPPIPPIPPVVLTCVGAFLTNTTAFTSDFSWTPYAGATGYNVYISEDATPTTFNLAYSNVPVGIYPLVCQSAIVTAITPDGETPKDCTPVHFCNTHVGPCGPISMDPSSLAPYAWWKADSFPALADTTPVGGPGLEWVDQSGNGRDAVTGLSNPTYRSPGLFFPGSGLPSVQFGNGAGDLQFAPWSVGNQDFTLVFLYAATPGGPLNIFLGCDDPFPGYPTVASASHGTYGFGDNTCGSVPSPADACADGGIGSGHPNVAIYRRVGGVLSFWNNSMDLGSVSYACSFWRPLKRLGASYLYAGFGRLEGNFGEVMLFDKGISDANIISLVEDYLRPKWCLTDCVL